ncbi:MAG: FIST C-terminal domain-containing protein [Candidatus Omnitrophota bacterium]|nr:MAG: FIST C-terminal domain-containing protein [Candidatus Omnitrophota bacterium]
MSIHVGLGTSEKHDAFLAGREAARGACQKAKQDFLDLLLVFASAKFDQQNLLRGIKSVCRDATIVGCSTAGEITTAGPAKNSVAIMGFKSDSLEFATGLGCGLSEDARGAGQKCAQQAIRTRIRKRHALVMLPDGLSGNGADVIRGAQEVLGTSFPIVGGSAGDDYLFKKTYQYYQDKVLSDSVVGILFGGEISIGIGIRHGWAPIGKAHQVTKSRGNVIEGLDGKEALRIYQDYFGDEAQQLKELSWAKIGTIYPLGMSIPDEEEYLIRYASRATPQGALVCAAEVPQGSQVRLMIADKDRVLNAAREAATRAKEGLEEAKISAIIVFDSIARKRILGRGASAEIEVIKKTLGKNIPVIGFYSYGEQAPLGAERYAGISYFHNETVVILAIAEAGQKER